MRSGDPEPIDELRNIVLAKQNGPSTTVDVVCDAAGWLKAALKGAGVPFRYASCEECDHYGFATFAIARSYRGDRVTLDLKIAEIRNEPYAFAEVHRGSSGPASLFPFFGGAASEDGRELLLHYAADFNISTGG